MLEDLCVVTLEFLVHLFLVRRLAHCSLRRFILLVETFMKSDVIEHIRLHPRFSRLPTPLCTLLWENWANMAQAAKNRNAPALQKWAFREEDCIPGTPQRSESWGAIWDTTFSKAKNKAFAKSEFSNSL